MTQHTVYVAVSGSNQGVSGVYPTAEAAIADLHRPGWVWTRTLWHYGSDPKVRGGGSEEWGNDQDWDSAISIRAYTYSDESAERLPDRIIAYWDANRQHMGQTALTSEEADRIAASSDWKAARQILELVEHSGTVGSHRTV